MDLYLVKENVQIRRTRRAFRRTTEYNKFIMELENDSDDNNSNTAESNDSDSSEDDDLRTVFTLSNLPVAINSVCEEINHHSERFAQRVEMKLTNEEHFGFDDIEFKLTISSDTNTTDNYFWIYAVSADGTKYDVFEQFREKLGINDFADYRIELSLCYLRNENSPVFPQSLLVLTGICGKRVQGQIPSGINLCAGGRTGYIYSKLSVLVTLENKATNLVYGYLGANESLLKDWDFADVKIRCREQKIVKCHRAVLCNKCEKLRHVFAAMMEDTDRAAGPWELQMNTSQKGVEALLWYIYCGRVDSGMKSCTDALEILLAARENTVVGLEQAMDEIITAKQNSDVGYFSVDGALDMYLFARNSVGLKHLRDKAIMVLIIYLRTKSGIVLESRKYQELFQNQQKIAMELSLLYIQLS